MSPMMPHSQTAIELDRTDEPIQASVPIPYPTSSSVGIVVPFNRARTCMAALITAKLNGGHGNRFQPIARQERSTLFIRSRLTSEIPNSANVATTKAAVRTAWSALRMDTTSNMCLSAFAPTYYSVFFAIRSFSIPTAVSFRRELHGFGGRAPAPCNEHFSD